MTIDLRELEINGISDEDIAVDYDFKLARDEYFRQCVAQDLVVVLPKPNELQIDIDSAEHWRNFQRALAAWHRNCGPLDVQVRPSKSGDPERKHVTVTVPFEVEPWQRIALQAAFGSDPMRELLSAVRLINGDDAPTLFVEARS